MNIAKVGRRGQIILPRAVRESLEIKEGDRLSFVKKGTEIVLKPITQTLIHLRGSVSVSERQDFKAIRRQVIKAHVQKRVKHGE
jgi:AbrB family looped-hinge helix DNA binding protein